MKTQATISILGIGARIYNSINYTTKSNIIALAIASSNIEVELKNRRNCKRNNDAKFNPGQCHTYEDESRD